MVTPCAISNLSLLWDRPNALKPQWNIIYNQISNGWEVQAKTYYWTTCCGSQLDNFCEHITWHPFS
jgi:hypothetical protein